MNLLQMRTLLRRRLQEPTADQWSDSDLNDLLNMSLARLQTIIMKYDPDAFLTVFRKDITVSQKYYETPADFLYIMTVEVLDVPSGNYGQIRSMKFQDTLNTVLGTAPIMPPVAQRYGRLGRKNLFLYPIPTATVANGLQITYCPTLVMANDQSVPDLPLVLHMAVVMRAQLYAMDETGEDAKAIQGALAEILSEIPTWYLRSADEPDTLDIDLGKDKLYGNPMAGVGALRNGIDARGWNY
jgi:hypothetical protein